MRKLGEVVRVEQAAVRPAAGVVDLGRGWLNATAFSATGAAVEVVERGLQAGLAPAVGLAHLGVDGALEGVGPVRLLQDRCRSAGTLPSASR